MLFQLEVLGMEGVDLPFEEMGFVFEEGDLGRGGGVGFGEELVGFGVD